MLEYLEGQELHAPAQDFLANYDYSGELILCNQMKNIDNSIDTLAILIKRQENSEIEVIRKQLQRLLETKIYSHCHKNCGTEIYVNKRTVQDILYKNLSQMF